MPADERPAVPERAPLLKRLEELAAELERQKRLATEAIERARRNAEITHRERGRRERARAGGGSALTDVLAARAAAELASEAKSRALAAVAHDLKQPLQVIAMTVDRLRAELAAGRLSADSGAASLDRIDRAVDQMAAAFDALLRVSRAEFGPAPVAAPMPLGPLLAAVDLAHRPVAEAKGLSLRCLPTRAVVLSDPEALSSILHNFVGNAVKYTERGGRVLVGCRRAGSRLEIEVHDTGPGIPPDAVGTIFEAFTRLDATEPGLGLGLSIAKRHADALGHELTCRSTPGRGSCFGVRVAREG